MTKVNLPTVHFMIHHASTIHHVHNVHNVHSIQLSCSTATLRLISQSSFHYFHSTLQLLFHSIVPIPFHCPYSTIRIPFHYSYSLKINLADIDSTKLTLYINFLYRQLFELWIPSHHLQQRRILRPRSANLQWQEHQR